MGQDTRGFLLYGYQAMLFKSLASDDLRGALIMAVFEYVYDGVVPTFDDCPAEHQANLQAFFNVIRQQRDKDKRHYDGVCDERAEAGRKGGLARAKKAKEREAEQANQANATNCLNSKQNQANQANQADRDLDRDLDKENDRGRGRGRFLTTDDAEEPTTTTAFSVDGDTRDQALEAIKQHVLESNILSWNHAIVSSLLSNYEMSWIISAIDRVALRNKEKHDWGNVMGILKSWKEKGGIDDPVPRKQDSQEEVNWPPWLN
ncbi:MAG: DUF6291 domain-containing protein [Christensenellales bacterium]|jgi:hypothetical protein